MPHSSSDSKPSSGPPPPAKKESILQLDKWMNAQVRVQCLGGRQLVGTLRGYDELVNLVLDDCLEFLLRDTQDDDPSRILTAEQTRTLGRVVVRGTQVSLVCPEQEREEIENPFVAAAHEVEE